jgi:hypothetical protein
MRITVKERLDTWRSWVARNFIDLLLGLAVAHRRAVDLAEDRERKRNGKIFVPDAPLMVMEYSMCRESYFA